MNLVPKWKNSLNLHLRIDVSNEVHTRFTIFEDGANCGEICMSSFGFYQFCDMLFNGQVPFDDLKISGKYCKDTIDETLESELRSKYGI